MIAQCSRRTEIAAGTDFDFNRVQQIWKVPQSTRLIAVKSCHFVFFFIWQSWNFLILCAFPMRFALYAFVGVVIEQAGLIKLAILWKLTAATAPSKCNSWNRISWPLDCLNHGHMMRQMIRKELEVVIIWIRAEVLSSMFCEALSATLIMSTCLTLLTTFMNWKLLNITYFNNHCCPLTTFWV